MKWELLVTCLALDIWNDNKVLIINLGVKVQDSQGWAIILNQSSSIKVLIITGEYSCNPSLSIYTKTLLGTVKMWTFAKIFKSNFLSLISLNYP